MSCTIGQCADNTIARAGYNGIGQIVAGIGDLSLSLMHGGLSHQQRVLTLFKFKFGNHFLGKKLLLAVIVKPGGGNFCFCRFEICQCGLQCCLVGNLIDDKKGLAFPDILTLFYIDRNDFTRDLWDNLNILSSPECGRRIGVPSEEGAQKGGISSL